MTNWPSPNLDQCLRFMSVGTGLTTFTTYREWVLSNHQTGMDVRAPGTTGWQYQVPFWTRNGEPNRQTFSKYTHFVEDPAPVDSLTGISLWHGYWCAGTPANNNYSTLVAADVKEGSDGRYVPEAHRKEISDTTIGIKFYCVGERQPRIRNDFSVDPNLVVLTMSLRIRNGGIYCLRFGIASNLYYVGGHAGGTRSDATYHYYTSQHGWDDPSETLWRKKENFSSSRTPEDEARTAGRHREIIDRLVRGLS